MLALHFAAQKRRVLWILGSRVRGNDVAWGGMTWFGGGMASFMDSGSRVRGNDVAIAGMTWVWRGFGGGNGVLYGFWVPASAGMT